MSCVLLDSNIVIDLLGGRPEALEEIRRYDELAISIITRIEVLAGGTPGQQELLLQTLDGFRLIELTRDVADRAAAIRRGRRLKLPDAVIQASAEVNELLLVTRNERDFPADMPGVRIPYRI